jgi:hypothetical protein
MMFDRITLVAMSPAGTTLVLRDRISRLWLYPPRGAGQPRVLDEEAIERVIARADLERVGREFESWPELEDFRQLCASRMAPPEAVDLKSLDGVDVERTIDVAERWLADGDGGRARQLVVALLDVPAALSDDATRRRLVELLKQMEQPPMPIHPEAATQLQRDAHERFQLARAA